MRAFILEIANMGRERNKGLRVLLIFGTQTDLSYFATARFLFGGKLIQQTHGVLIFFGYFTIFRAGMIFTTFTGKKINYYK